MTNRDIENVIRGADVLGVCLDRSQATLLLRHLEFVLRRNQVLNLTAITEWQSAVRLLVLDSLAVARHVDPRCSRVVDIGSGAGYPGIPLAVATHIPVDLAEPTKKKADFLTAAVTELGGLTGSAVLPSRAEDLAIQKPAHYDIAVVRAVAALPSLVELASPLLALGGALLAMKGSPTVEERESGRIVSEMVGMRETGWWEYSLPWGGEARTIARYTMIAEPSRTLPRRVGQAQKRPLA